MATTRNNLCTDFKADWEQFTARERTQFLILAPVLGLAAFVFTFVTGVLLGLWTFLRFWPA